MIAELGFGFWRYLCTSAHLTTMWVPALNNAFSEHPASGDARRVRADVDARVDPLHFLRNRIAHHEPIHQRQLADDLAATFEVVGWVDPDAQAWAQARSRTAIVLSQRP